MAPFSYSTALCLAVACVQPLILYNLPRGWRLRSSAIWAVDFVGDSSYVPIGFGFGKVIQTSGPTVNLYVGPQVSASPTGRSLWV